MNEFIKYMMSQNKRKTKYHQIKYSKYATEVHWESFIKASQQELLIEKVPGRAECFLRKGLQVKEPQH